ncbi:unnamed protein product [Rhizophagus irregularis]|nr:unnamed protein product [Rhizophagus irregularis]
MFNLAICYENGKGTEKNYKKAFYWYQKEAGNGNEIAMFNLAICYNNANSYYNGEGTEKNLGRAFHWYQKAAVNGNEKAMFNLAKSYYDGKGTEKECKKIFLLVSKAAENESSKVRFKNEVELCNECKQLYIDYQWCQQCNTKRFQQDFSKWTSKNEFVDKFIQEAQLNAKNSYEILEWIPYNKLSSIDYYDKGGFSEIHKAIWLDGPIYSWNFKKHNGIDK